MDEALELRGEHHVHENEGKQKRHQEAAHHAPELLGLAQQARFVLGGQPKSQHHFVGLVDGITDGGSLQVGRDGHRPLPVDAIDLGWSARLDDARHVVEPRQADLRRSHVESGNDVRAVAVVAVDPQADLIKIVALLVLGDVFLAADHGAQTVGDVLNLDSEILGAVAVDAHPQFGLGEGQGGVDVDDSRDLLESLHDGAGVFAQAVEIGPRKHVVEVRDFKSSARNRGDGRDRNS